MPNTSALSPAAIEGLRKVVDSLPSPHGTRHPDMGAYFLAAYYTVADRLRTVRRVKVTPELLAEPMVLYEALEVCGNGPEAGNCGNCGKGPEEGGDGTAVKRCSGCGPSGMWYCGPDCQRVDWHYRHKFLCERRKAA